MSQIELFNKTGVIIVNDWLTVWSDWLSIWQVATLQPGELWRTAIVHYWTRGGGVAKWIAMLPSVCWAQHSDSRLGISHGNEMIWVSGPIFLYRGGQKKALGESNPGPGTHCNVSKNGTFNWITLFSLIYAKLLPGTQFTAGCTEWFFKK